MIVQISVGAIVLATCGFFVSRAAGGVIGEYGKRFWFKRVEPLLSRWALALTTWLKQVLTSKADLEKACADLRAENAELRLLTQHLARVIADRDDDLDTLPRSQRLIG